MLSFELYCSFLKKIAIFTVHIDIEIPEQVLIHSPLADG